jgi:transcription initiation factor TFIID subunit 5
MEFHAQDIQKLSSLMMPMHLKENELALRFRQNKFNLKMSEYSFKLMMSFLQDNGFLLLLRIINEHLNILAFVGKPKESPEDKLDSSGVMTGSSLQVITSINNKPIMWGRLPEDQDLVDAIEAKFQEMEKAGEFKIHEKDKKLMLQRRSTPDLENVAPSRDRVPLPRFRDHEVLMEISALQELRDQIKLSRSELPSIACYSFHNTHDSMTTIQFSPDSLMVSTGTDESIIKVWSVKGDHLRGLKTNIDVHPSDISAGRSSPLKSEVDLDLISSAPRCPSGQIQGERGKHLQEPDWPLWNGLRSVFQSR